MQRVKPYFENVFPPGSDLLARGFVTTTMEHVIEVNPHWHPEVEVLYYLSGAALQQVNDQFFTAEAGDLVVIGRDQLHSTYTIARNNCRILVLQFDAQSLLRAPEGADAAGNYDTAMVYGNPIRLAAGEGDALIGSMEEAAREMEDKRPGYECLVRGALYRFTGLLTRFAPRRLVPSTPETVSGVHQMLQYTFRLVDASYAEEITLAQAAAASSLSVTHFCRLFKRATGMTFHEYLSFYRVNRAEQLLPTAQKLTELAYDCGFGSVSSFIRNFRKYKNCSPSHLCRRRRCDVVGDSDDLS